MLHWFRRKSPAQLRLERINAYIDGELTPAERTAFEQEMNRDAELQAEVEALRVLDSLLNELPQVDVPRNFTVTAPEPAPRSVGRQLMPALAGLTMIVLLCGVLLNLFNNNFMGAPEQIIVTQIVETVKEVEVPGETVVEEVVVTSVVEVPGETVVEEVVVTVVVEVVATPLAATAEPETAADESEEVAPDSAIDVEFPTTRNHWRTYSTISDTVQNELAISDTIPRLYRSDEPLLADFESALMAFEESQLLVVDLRLASWEDGETLDSADVAFTYQTCRDLQLYAIDNANNGWATACSPDALQDIIAVSQTTVQFTLAADTSREQFMEEIAQAPIMAEHIWGTIVAEALAFEEIAEGRNYLLSTTP